MIALAMSKIFAVITLNHFVFLEVYTASLYFKFTYSCILIVEITSLIDIVLSPVSVFL